MIPYSMNPLGINNELSDLDILRQIRNANPTSQLPSLWLDTEDPYTQWEGVTWNAQKTRVTVLRVNSRSISTLSNINKLTYLQGLDCWSNQLRSLDLSGLIYLKGVGCDSNQLTSLNVSGAVAIKRINCYNNQLSSLDVTGLSLLYNLTCQNNQLTSIPSITSKGSIQFYDFRYNNMPTSETNRLIALNFDSNSVLPQNP